MAYGVQAKLNAEIMMVTIRVNRFCLMATIFAILPVDLIDCYNIYTIFIGFFSYIPLIIFLRFNTFRNGQNLPFYEFVQGQLRST